MSTKSVLLFKIETGKNVLEPKQFLNQHLKLVNIFLTPWYYPYSLKNHISFLIITGVKQNQLYLSLPLLLDDLKAKLGGQITISHPMKGPPLHWGMEIARVWEKEQMLEPGAWAPATYSPCKQHFQRGLNLVEHISYFPYRTWSNSVSLNGKHDHFAWVILNLYFPSYLALLFIFLLY